MHVKDNVAFVTGGASGIGLGRCSVVAFVGRARRQRTITKQQVFARTHDLEGAR